MKRLIKKHQNADGKLTYSPFSESMNRYYDYYGLGKGWNVTEGNPLKDWDSTTWTSPNSRLSEVVVKSKDQTLRDLINAGYNGSWGDYGYTTDEVNKMKKQMAQEQHDSTVDKFDKYSKATADGIAMGVSAVIPVLGALYWGSTAGYDASKGNYVGAGMRGIGAVLPAVEQYSPAVAPWLNGAVQSVVGGASASDMINNGVNTENVTGLTLSLLPVVNKGTVQNTRTEQTQPSKLLLEDIHRFNDVKVPYKEVPFDNSDFIKDYDILSTYEARIANKGIDPTRYNNAKIIYYDTPEGQEILRKHVKDYVLTPKNPKYDKVMKFLQDKNFKNEEDAINYYAQYMYDEPAYSPVLDMVMMPSKTLQLAKTDRGLFENYNLVRAHEFGHASHFPESPIGEEFNTALKDHPYWTQENNTEIGVRLEQLLNKAGITSPNFVTPTRWKNLFESYLNSNKYDNNMKELYNAINSVENGWRKVAQWAADPKNVWAIAPVAVGAALSDQQNSNSTNETQYALGGKLTYIKQLKNYL